MTPLSVSYLALEAKDILPLPAELAARCRTPRDELPKSTAEATERLLAVASPAAVIAFGKRSPELTALLHLEGIPALCTPQIALFAVTLGYGVDRLLEAEKRRGIADAYLLDAVASAMAEAGADAADAALRAHYPQISFGRRLSPGYGKLPLSLEKPILSLLGADKQLGMRLSESFLLHPTKSITAILGGRDEI